MNTIIIADDHPITLAGMKTFIEKLGFEVLGIYDNGISAYNNIVALKPDYAILDLSMPGMNGLEVLEKVKAQNKTIKVIIYTMYTEITLFKKAINLGVNGYILKEFATQELEICINTLKNKKVWFSPKLQEKLIEDKEESASKNIDALTPSEIKIVSLIAEEKTTKQIAEMLFISEKTVENHRSHIIKKLKLPASKNALLIWALEKKGKLHQAND